MEQRELIRRLEAVLANAEAAKLDIGYARNVFEGGEWLLALIDLEIASSEDARFHAQWGDELKKIRQAMGDPENPYQQEP